MLTVEIKSQKGMAYFTYLGHGGNIRKWDKDFIVCPLGIQIDVAAVSRTLIPWNRITEVNTDRSIDFTKVR